MKNRKRDSNKTLSYLSLSIKFELFEWFHSKKNESLIVGAKHHSGDSLHSWIWPDPPAAFLSSINQSRNVWNTTTLLLFCTTMSSNAPLPVVPLQCFPYLWRMDMIKVPPPVLLVGGWRGICACFPSGVLMPVSHQPHNMQADNSKLRHCVYATIDHWVQRTVTTSVGQVGEMTTK